MTPNEFHAQLGDFDGSVPLDIRFAYEWKTGHIPHSIRIELGELSNNIDSLPKQHPYTTICAGGIRASTAASLLESNGFRDISIMSGGITAWAKNGYSLDADDS